MSDPLDRPTSTAAERDLSVDFYRVSAISLVVVGHWLAALVTYQDGDFGILNLLTELPWTQWLTLVFQVIPAFFLMAGYASASSCIRRQEKSIESPQHWLRERLSRTLGPTVAYAVTVLAVVLVLFGVGVDTGLLQFGGWAVGYHLWFLVVFVLLMAVTPVAMAADRRWGLVAPAGLVIVLALVDVAYLVADVPHIGYLNYLLGWAVVYQLGIAWRTGRLSGFRPLLLAAVSTAVLAVLVTWGPYPVSMIGVPGAELQNTAPPSLALVAFAGAQAGVLLAASPWVDRWLKASGVQRRLAAANSIVMGLYLWHMVPVVVVALIGYPSGLLTQAPVASADWWWGRLIWVSAIAVVMMVLMAVLRWQRAIMSAPLPTLTVPIGAPWGLPVLLVGAVVCAAAVLMFPLNGFAPHGGFPLLAAVLLAAGAVLVALTPRDESSVSSRSD